MARLSTRRSDKRWIAEDGEVWDSKFECLVYDQLSALGVAARRTVKGEGDSPDLSDTFRYDRPIRSAACLECDGTRVVQRCTYTPDLRVTPKGTPGSDVAGYYIEIKGYFQQTKRAAFRDFRKGRPDVPVRFIFNSDHKVGKGRLQAYMDTYLKGVPYLIWSGTKPGPSWTVPRSWM